MDSSLSKDYRMGRSLVKLLPMKTLLLLLLVCSNAFASMGTVSHPTTTGITGMEAYVTPPVTGYSARVTDDGELAVTSTEREKNVWMDYHKLGNVGDSYAILVDLSDTTTFPHASTGRIDISFIRITIDRDSSATGELEMGVITRIDGTDADVSFFFDEPFIKSNARHIETAENFAPSQLKTGVTNGLTPFLITNDTINNIAAVNTGVTLSSPAGVGSVTPAVGDILLFIDHGAGTFDIDVDMFYHSED